MRTLIWLALVTIAACSSDPNQKTDSIDGMQPVTFQAEDSLTIYGDLLLTDKDHPTVLLFHQGMSNARAEYAPIIDRLQKERPNLNIMTIDQRSGGQIYGLYNRTIYNLKPFNWYTMCEAYPDLEAALSFIKSKQITGPIVLWGSSYSGSLAIQLGANYQDDISGVLAFSPASGEVMNTCKPDQYIENLDVPLIAFRPSNEMQGEAVKKQMDLIKESGHQTFVADNGTHGSSMLVERRVGQPVDATWQRVLDFMDEVTQQ